jgi:hypothetical protein
MVNVVVRKRGDELLAFLPHTTHLGHCVVMNAAKEFRTLSYEEYKKTEKHEMTHDEFAPLRAVLQTVFETVVCYPQKKFDKEDMRYFKKAKRRWKRRKENADTGRTNGNGKVSEKGETG